MNKPQIANNITRAFGKVGLGLKKHSPEILVTTGIVGVVTSAVLACKATPKAVSIVEKSKQDIEKCRNILEHPEQYNITEKYTKEDAKKDTAIIYTKTGINLAKVYGPALALGALSITCILAGNNILHKRNVALAAAYTTVETSFKDYRKRVVERFGEDLDKELRYNVKAQEIEETVIDEKGKEKTVKKTTQTVDSSKYSGYERFFDEWCTGWTKDPEKNLWFLTMQQNYANEKLKARGYMFLNDVYEMLGIRPSKAGQVVGWIYKKDNPSGDNHIDFISGIYDVRDEAKRDFVNGREKSILLDFNVDGPIWELI